MFGSTVVAAAATLLMTALTVPLLLPLARRIGLLDRPGGRRKHDKPVPAIGGLAILLAVGSATFLFLPPTPQLLGLGGAVLIIATAGVIDDMFRLRWQYRLTAQVLGALVLIYFAELRVENVGQIFGFSAMSLGVLSTPLTVLATVGVINAVNMADGVDGLAGVLGLVVTAMLAAAALYSGNGALAVGMGLVAGGLCGFLVYNLRTPWNPRARIFLGNAGSELLGLLIACACFRLTQNAAHPVGVHIAPFLIAPVLIDCLSLMVRRARRGVSPFCGDRNHLHHMLLDAGLKPTGVVVVISGLTLVIGIGAAVAMKAHVPAPYFTVTFVSMLVAYFLVTGDRDRFVAGLSGLGLQLRLVAPPKPLEPWQIAARDAGRYYRRASDRPVDAEPALSTEALISRIEAANLKAGDAESGELSVARDPQPDQASARALVDSSRPK